MLVDWTGYALLGTVADPGRRLGVRLDLFEDGHIRFEAIGQPGWGPDAALCQLVLRSAPSPARLAIDLTQAPGPLPAARPVRVAGEFTPPAAAIEDVPQHPQDFDLVVRDGLGAELARGPLGVGFAFDLCAWLRPGGVPDPEADALLAVRVAGPTSLRAWLTRLGPGASGWNDPLELLAPAEVSAAPLLSWSGVEGDPADLVTRVHDSGARALAWDLALWLWAEPEACNALLDAQAGSALEGTLRFFDVEAWGELPVPGAAPGAAPRAGLALHATSPNDVTFSLWRPPAPGGAPAQALRALRDGGVPTEVLALDLQALGIDQDGAGGVHGAFAVAPAQCLALLAGQTDLTFVVDEDAAVAAYQGQAAHEPVHLFAHLTPQPGVNFGSHGGQAATDLVVVGAGEVEHHTVFANPAPAAVTGVRVLADAGGEAALTNQAVPGAEMGTGEGGAPLAFVARLLGDPGGHDLVADVGATIGARGPLAPAFMCEASYIPPFEGLWEDDNFDTWQFLGPSLPVSCGAATVLDPNFVALPATYSGDTVTVTLDPEGTPQTYVGTVTEPPGEPGNAEIEFVNVADAGDTFTCTHSEYRWPDRGVWVTPDRSMVLTVTGGFGPGEELTGFVRVGGLDHAFTSAGGHGSDGGFAIGEWDGASPPAFGTSEADFYLLLSHDEVTFDLFDATNVTFTRLTPQR